MIKNFWLRFQASRALARLLRRLSTVDGVEAEALANCAEDSESEAILLAHAALQWMDDDPKHSAQLYGRVLSMKGREGSNTIEYLQRFARYNLAIRRRNWGEAKQACRLARKQRVTGSLRLRFPLIDLPRGFDQPDPISFVTS